MEIMLISSQSQVEYYNVTSLIVCSVVGWINILPNHSFMITKIVNSTMTILTQNQSYDLLHPQGFLSVHNNKIVITLL